MPTSALLTLLRGFAPGLLLLPAGSAAAQVILVHAVEEGTRTAAPSAILALQTADGRSIVRVLTDLQGRATLTAPRPGTYRVRGDRIGFAGASTSRIVLGVGDTVRITLALPVDQVMLPEVMVQRRQPSCGAPGVAGREMVAVWDAARKALTAAELTQSVTRPTLEVTRTRRERDRRGRILREWSLGRYRTANSPFRTIEADRLWADGFSVPDGDGFEIFGPDARLLLSEAFLDYHCFRLVRGEKDRDGQVGLAFEPLPGREVPDIAGTLWLERRGARLRDLDFEFVGIGPSAPGVVRASGSVEFTPVEGIGWIISRWRLAGANLTVLRGARFGNEMLPDQWRLDGWTETVGEARIAGQQRATTRSIVAGVVWDSSAGGALAGARVVSATGTPSAIADRDGRWRLEVEDPREVLLRVDHPRFHLLGVPIEGEMTDMGDSWQLDFVIPGHETLLGRLCDDEVRRDPALGLLAVQLLDRDSIPLAQAHVRARWSQFEVVGSGSTASVVERRRTAEGTTDPNGVLRICGVMVDALVRLSLLDRAARWEASHRLDRRLETVRLTVPPRR